MPADSLRRGWTSLAERLRAARGRQAETPYTLAQRRHEQVRDAFLDARDALRAVLEDLIEGETRKACPAASDLDVEVYTDELGEPRGRLIAVNTEAGPVDEHEDEVREEIAELLDEWAVTANADSTNICFREPSAPPGPATAAA